MAHASRGRKSSPDSERLPASLEVKGVLRSFAAHSELFQQGASSDEIYILHSGAVKLTWTDAVGHGTIVGLRFKGRILGESSCIAGKPYPFSAVTLAKSELERISGPDFLRRWRADPEFAMAVARAQSSEILDHITDRGELACATATHRFMTLVRRMDEVLGKDARSSHGGLMVPLQKQEIAAYIAVDPATMSRILKDLQRKGIIRLKGDWIIVP